MPQSRPSSPRTLPLVLAPLLVLVAAGCSGSSPTEPGVRGPSVQSVEIGSYSRINASRRDDGKAELLLDPALSEVARGYSERMRDEGFFGHQDPGGGGLVGRLRAAGIGFSVAGENLAQVTGAEDPAAVTHELLMSNPEHRGNILDARFTEVGIGVARFDDSYWITQVFVRP